jgi:hypothetical protein
LDLRALRQIKERDVNKLALFPAGLGGFAGYLGLTLIGHSLGARPPALTAQFDSRLILLRRRRVFGFAARNINDQAGELVRIAWALGCLCHAENMAAYR